MQQHKGKLGNDIFLDFTMILNKLSLLFILSSLLQVTYCWTVRGRVRGVWNMIVITNNEFQRSINCHTALKDR